MSALAVEDVVSKGRFAEIINVSPGRVSQMISEGKIPPAALVGEGRGAKILVADAIAGIRAKTDIGQRFGNGISTKLDLSPTQMVAAAANALPLADPLEEQIKRERLRALEFSNRRHAEDELARRGAYTDTTEARAAMVGIATSVLQTFEGGLADLANAISAEFKVPQRDVLHLMRREFVAVRAKAALAAERRMKGLPPLVADEPPGDEA